MEESPMQATPNNKPWQFQKFTIPAKEPDSRCQARIRKDGQERYCDVETGGGRCLQHDPNKKRRAARDSEQQRLQSQVAALTDGQKETLWEEIPVDPATFCRDFLKEPLFPKQQEFVEAMLGKDPKAWDTTFTEGIALWGRGSGKDSTAAKFLTYVAYRLLCLSSPQGHLGMAQGDKIALVNVGLNVQQAHEAFFSKLRWYVEHAINPTTGHNWFEEHGLDLKRAILAREIRFPKSVTAYSLDSEGTSAEGWNLLVVVFDEIGGFEPQRAKELYTVLRMTACSRFPQSMKVLLLSYKRSDTDYMMTRYREAEFEPETFRSGPYATWEVNPKLTREDFVAEYTRDPETAQQVYECTGTTQEPRFFAYRARIAQVIAAANKENPVLGDRLSVMELRNLQFKPWFKPQPTSGYFIHVDLGKGQDSAAGLALGHFKRDMVVSLPDDYLEALARDSGQSLEALRKQHGQQTGGVVIDLALQIKAPPGGEILFDEVRVFIERLRKDGWPIRLVTLDSWQSYAIMQGLRRVGISAQEQSVDKDGAAYGHLKALIYQGLFECYPHKILMRELEELRVTATGKVDHPEVSFKRSAEEDGINKGSKDVADAVAGCAALCLRYGKSNFTFGVAGGPIISALPANAHLLRYESEDLVRYGQKPKRYKFR